MGRDRFDEWYRRGHALVTATGDQHKIEMFEDDWHPDGVMAAAAAVLIRNDTQDHSSEGDVDYWAVMICDAEAKVAEEAEVAS
jgi:hypothetical protein